MGRNQPFSDRTIFLLKATFQLIPELIPEFMMDTFGGFLSHRGSLSSHPFLDRMFPNKNHPAIGVPPIQETPIKSVKIFPTFRQSNDRN